MFKNKQIKNFVLILLIIMFINTSKVPAVDTSNITGVNPVNNVYNINPQYKSGTTGFRHYNNFDLKWDDVANLNFNGINKFINAVDAQIQIYGLLNTVRNGSFYNGKAIFISPKGMIVGNSGIVNVGSLNVYTPNKVTYENLTKSINSDSTFAQYNLSDEELDSSKYYGNGDIRVFGRIIAKEGITLKGRHINCFESLVSGVNNKNSNDSYSQNAVVNTKDVLDAKRKAYQIVDMFVNTGLTSNNNFDFATKNGKVVLASKNGMMLDTPNNIAVNGDISIKHFDEHNNCYNNKISISGKIIGNGKITIHNTSNKHNEIRLVNGSSIKNIGNDNIEIISQSHTNNVNSTNNSFIDIKGNIYNKGDIDIKTINKNYSVINIYSTSELKSENSQSKIILANLNSNVANSENEINIGGKLHARNLELINSGKNGSILISNNAQGPNINATAPSSIVNIFNNVTNNGEINIKNYYTYVQNPVSMEVNGNINIVNYANKGNINIDGVVIKNVRATGAGGVTNIQNASNGDINLNGKITAAGLININKLGESTEGDIILGSNSEIITTHSGGKVNINHGSKGDIVIAGKTDTKDIKFVKEGGNGDIILENTANISSTGAATKVALVNNASNIGSIETKAGSKINVNGMLDVINMSKTGNINLNGDIKNVRATGAGGVTNIQNASSGDINLNDKITAAGLVNISKTGKNTQGDIKLDSNGQIVTTHSGGRVNINHESSGDIKINGKTNTRNFMISKNGEAGNIEIGETLEGKIATINSEATNSKVTLLHNTDGKIVFNNANVRVNGKLDIIKEINNKVNDQNRENNKIIISNGASLNLFRPAKNGGVSNITNKVGGVVIENIVVSNGIVNITGYNVRSLDRSKIKLGHSSARININNINLE